MSRAVGVVGLLTMMGCASSDPSSVTVAVPPSSEATASSAAPTTSAVPVTVVSTAPVADSLRIGFETAESVEGWATVNDPVMGGRSISSVAWRDAALVFSGELSLENNGGFASLVAPSDAVPAGAWVGRDGVRVVGSGDAKTYLLQLRSGDGSYVQRFVADATFSTLLRFEDFVATSRFLDPLPDGEPLDPGGIVGLAVYIVDEQVGPFELSLTAID